ncbi:MAG: ATP-binding cassette domain-containing protein [Lachnospiraceae bacterium]|nr:ATP-binding cassette domain-containing protein [Lachnospiraceae bacterium]
MSLIVDIEKKLGSFILKVSFETGNESVSLLGESGCGKSMTLKCIAGIEKPDRGRIVLDGRVLFDSEKGIDLPPQERRVGYLFQEGALFPNMSILDNVICGIREKSTKREKEKTTREMLERMHLSDTEKRRPDSLSGGQRQRAALARILVNKPEILLLDEPFSALDAHLRFELERVVSDTIRELKKPAILVSHNRDEAFRITDKIAIMKDGAIETVGERHSVFVDPQTVYAARMTGCKNVAAAYVPERHGDGSFVSGAERQRDGSFVSESEDKRTVPMSLVYVPDWGIELTVLRSDRTVNAVGIRMHDIILGRGDTNEFCCRVEEEIENPFSYTIMVTPDRHEDGSFRHGDGSFVCRTPQTKEPSLCLPLGVEVDKITWEAARAETVTIHIPPENVLLLRE